MKDEENSKKQERGGIYSKRIRSEAKNKFKPKMMRGKIIWETKFENTDKGPRQKWTRGCH